MDNFLEEVVVRRKSGLYNFLFFLSWALMLICAVLALIALQGVLGTLFSGNFNLTVLIFFLVFGGAAFLLFRNKDELRIEYEYTFTNGDLDVSKVLNNQKRKYLTCVNMKNVEAAGLVSSPAFQRYVTMPDVKKHNWFLNREAQLYYLYFTKNAVKHLVVLELSNEMAALVHKPNYMNHGVWQG